MPASNTPLLGGPGRILKDDDRRSDLIDGLDGENAVADDSPLYDVRPKAVSELLGFYCVLGA